MEAICRGEVLLLQGGGTGWLGRQREVVGRHVQ